MKLEFQKICLPLRDFSLQLDSVLEGPSIALCGPSGAGKTSLLELIAGLRQPGGGTLIFNGTVFSREKKVLIPPEHRRFGYCPQENLLFPHLNVRQNILFGVRGPEPAGLGELCQGLEIGPLMARYPATLSGGEKQRVSLARALVRGPQLLLLDEPFASLDDATKANSVRLLKRTVERLSLPFICVTHSEPLALELCVTRVDLNRGRMLS
ncbi:MAG: ATP-binding cassette domain-containing protein [Verrucomicrobiae bacterium]|nr:ATP-binding cassette domain-containing protein [Verrucomicrobiae bacterium]